MSEAEWIEFAGRLEATFRGGLSDDREHELRRYVGRVPFGMACVALERMVVGSTRKAPQVFTPTPSEFVAALRIVAGGDWNLRAALAGEDPVELAARLNARLALPAGEAA